MRGVSHYFSAALAAFVIAAGLNVWIAAAHPLSNWPTANLDTSEAARAVAAWHREKATPEIVLLGSSLVVAPVMQAEANYLGNPIERMFNRRSTFLEKQVSDQKRRPHVFCFAIGGEMVSDAYLLAKNVLQQRPPAAIIFGIAPRDVQDSLLPGIQSSETYKTTASLSDSISLLRSHELSFEQGGDLLLSQLVPLWNYRSDFRTYALLRAKKTITAMLPWVVLDRYDAYGNLGPRRIGQFPEEVKGVVLVRPGEAMPHANLEKTRHEYIARYNPLNFEAMDQQFEYLDKLLSLCRQRHINIVMVNMPLSQDNLALMPKGLYTYFWNRVRSECAANNVSLIDMCKAPLTRNDLYADGVHIDSGFSQQFLTDVLAKLRNSKLAFVREKAI